MVKIKFEEISINQISNSAGVFSGDNLQIRWQAVSKSTEGYGTLDGNKNLYKNGQSKVKKILIKQDK